MLFCALGYAAQAPAFPCPTKGILEKNNIRAEINLDTTSQQFGALEFIADRNSGFLRGGETWFGLRAGNAFAAGRHVLINSPETIAVVLDQFPGLSIRARMQYVIQASCILLDFSCVLLEKTEFKDGLDFEISTSFDSLYAWNHTDNGIRASLRNVSTYSHHNNFLKFFGQTGSLLLFIRNPFHSYLNANWFGDLHHAFRLIPTVKSNGEPSAPDCYSYLQKGDTILRRIELYPANRSVEAPIYLSLHPNGYSQCITMFWDELPNRDNWAYMTTDTAKDAMYDHFFPRLLQEHPKLKMGYLLMADRILFPPTQDVPFWIASAPYFFLDTLDKTEGSRCLLLSATQTRTIRFLQYLLCSPNTKYRMSYWIKTFNVTGTGAYGEVYGSDTNLIYSDMHIRGTQQWEKREFAFTAADKDSLLQIYVRLQDGTGMAFFDDIRLMRDGDTANLLKNGGFELGKIMMGYDNERRHWTDAHGPEWLVCKAPESYLQFLRSIGDTAKAYGWEDRVRLGCHGYHHSPAIDRPDPEWEFYYYNPLGDSLRIARIFADIRKIGLTKKSLRFCRTPGYKYTKSVLDLLVDSGFVFIDARHDWKSYPAYSCSFVQRGGKVLWANGSCWWGDISNNMDPGIISKVLKQGYLAHIGSHPEQLFYYSSEQSYQRFNKIITDQETAFPNMGYVFPDDWADNASSIYRIAVKDCRIDGNTITLSVSGTISSGSTFLYDGTCTEARLDGNRVDSVREFFGKTAFIFAQTAGNSHTLELKGCTNKIPTFINLPAKKSGLTRSILHSSEYVYDLQGRKCKPALKYQRQKPGIYFKKAQIDGKMKIDKIIMP